MCPENLPREAIVSHWVVTAGDQLVKNILDIISIMSHFEGGSQIPHLNWNPGPRRPLSCIKMHELLSIKAVNYESVFFNKLGIL